MDVAYRIRSSWPILLAACLHLSWGGRSLADPMYTAIDLGTGSLTYGVDSSGNGTVTGSNALTYTFNPVHDYLPAQWRNNSQGVPVVASASLFSYVPINNSTLSFMNSQGLAAGVDWYSIGGHMTESKTFITQQQPDGSWGTPTLLWSGAESSAAMWPGPSQSSILGVSPNGQVLGIGASDPHGVQSFDVLYLYDTKTHTLTDLSSQSFVVDQSPWWFLSIASGQLDNQGRILVHATSQAIEAKLGPDHNVLLIPAGLSTDPVPAPEPATWAIFAILLGGWMARRRLCSRADRKEVRLSGLTRIGSGRKSVRLSA